MSQQNVEIVKRLLDAINRRDLNVVEEFATPDVEFIPAGQGVCDQGATTSPARGVAGRIGKSTSNLT